jgi:hypothetical protein
MATNTFFKINNTDISSYINELKIEREANYNAQTNAAGDTVVDLINHKRSIEVGIIPVNSEVMKSLQAAINDFNVTISFRNPTTGLMEYDVNCIIPSTGVEYQMILYNRVMFKAFTLTFIEL